MTILSFARRAKPCLALLLAAGAALQAAPSLTAYKRTAAADPSQPAVWIPMAATTLVYSGDVIRVTVDDPDRPGGRYLWGGIGQSAMTLTPEADTRSAILAAGQVPVSQFTVEARAEDNAGGSASLAMRSFPWVPEADRDHQWDDVLSGFYGPNGWLQPQTFSVLKACTALPWDPYAQAVRQVRYLEQDREWLLATPNGVWSIDLAGHAHHLAGTEGQDVVRLAVPPISARNQPWVFVYAVATGRAEAPYVVRGVTRQGAVEDLAPPFEASILNQQALTGLALDSSGTVSVSLQSRVFFIHPGGRLDRPYMTIKFRVSQITAMTLDPGDDSLLISFQATPLQAGRLCRRTKAGDWFEMTGFQRCQARPTDLQMHGELLVFSDAQTRNLRVFHPERGSAWGTAPALLGPLESTAAVPAAAAGADTWPPESPYAGIPGLNGNTLDCGKGGQVGKPQCFALSREGVCVIATFLPGSDRPHLVHHDLEHLGLEALDRTRWATERHRPEAYECKEGDGAAVNQQAAAAAAARPHPEAYECKDGGAGAVNQQAAAPAPARAAARTPYEAAAQAAAQAASDGSWVRARSNRQAD